MQEQNSHTPGAKVDSSSFLSHFRVMMGPYGLYQHATIREPLLSEGYCVDDNARAVQMLAALLPQVSSTAQPEVVQLLQRCWQFLIEAEAKPGQYYNFRSAAGTWLPEGRSDDMYARLVRAGVAVLGAPGLSPLHGQATAMVQTILGRSETMHAPRFWAEILVAIGDIPQHLSDVAVVSQAQRRAVAVLTTAWQSEASASWPWFEPTMTYANALLPHGVLAAVQAGESLIDEQILHASAAFLITTTVRDGIFIPIGSRGWYPRGGKPSHDNQQAIEAATMFDFLLAYQAVFPKRVTADAVEAPYQWFFGRNTGNVVMADTATGACLDGIFVTGPNPNCGAESMLAYQWAELLQRRAAVLR